MKNGKIEDKLIKQPYYEGGDKALKAFISSQIQYPEISKNLGIEGDVHLKYDIDYKGFVTNVKVIGGLDTFCNEEAIRVVKMLRFVVPKLPRHLKVVFHKSITIHFRNQTSSTFVSTENEPSTESNPHINTFKISYTLVPTSDLQDKTDKSTFSYTIIKH